MLQNQNVHLQIESIDDCKYDKPKSCNFLRHAVLYNGIILE